MSISSYQLKITVSISIYIGQCRSHEYRMLRELFGEMTGEPGQRHVRHRRGSSFLVCGPSLSATACVISRCLSTRRKHFRRGRWARSRSSLIDRHIEPSFSLVLCGERRQQWRNRGQKGQLPPPLAQQARGRKTASPKYFMTNDHSFAVNLLFVTL